MDIPKEVNLTALEANQVAQLPSWDEAREKAMDTADGCKLAANTLRDLAKHLRSYASNTSCIDCYQADYHIMAAMGGVFQIYANVLGISRMHPLHHDHSSDSQSLQDIWKEAIPIIQEFTESINSAEASSQEFVSRAQATGLYLQMFHAMEGLSNGK